MARVIDASDYQDLYQRCRRAPPQIRADMRTHLRDAAKIGANAAKVRARSISRGGAVSRWRTQQRSRSLGSILAANIRVSVKGDDVRIVQGTAGIGGRNAAGLPRGLDDFVGFEHPVFGHGRVLQAGKPYFQRSMDEKRDEMIREVARVLDDVLRHLT